MTKEEQQLEKRLIELSRAASQRNIKIYSDFLNLNELNILHSVPKNELYSTYITFGGYDTAERQMAVFLPDALCLRKSLEHSSFPFSAFRIEALHKKYARELTHRDYLGTLLSLGIERSKLGDILVEGTSAVFFVHETLNYYLKCELTRIRNTSVKLFEENLESFQYAPCFEEIKGSVASVRLDSLVALAFSSSRSRLSGLIEGGRVFVNGKLMTTNAFHVKEEDIISVRGMGKFQYKGIISQTKKNRNLILLHKYI